MKAKILDPQIVDKGSQVRGGGRFISLLKDYLGNSFSFISDVSEVNSTDTLIVPFFQLFQKPFLTKRIARKQILLIYDMIPVKFASHFPVGIKGRLNQYLNRFYLKNYDEIVTISEVSKQDIISYLGVPSEKIQVIYPILSKQLKSKNEELPVSLPSNILNLKSKFCIYVGDVNWNKNIVNIAKAAKRAHIPMVFVGKAFESLIGSRANELASSHPWLKEFQEFSNEVKDNPIFIFPGYVSDDELQFLYKNATLNILVSRDEGFGFSYLEAANMSTPSLLSNTPIFHEIAQDAAVFVDPENPEEIAQNITLIMNSETLQKEVGEKAQKRAAFFNPITFKEQWEKIIH